MMNHSYGYDPTTLPDITYVQLADPSTFRAVVQRLTGATEDDPSSAPKKLPLTLPARYTNPNNEPAAEVGPLRRRQAFKLHERRGGESTKNLELHLTTKTSSSQFCRPVMMSPVSPFEFMALGSPRSTPASPVMVDERGLFLMSPVGTTQRRHDHDPPELLPLFPLHSSQSLT